MRRFLTVRDLARVLHRHPETIRLWIRRGEIPEARRVRDGWRIDASAVERLLKPARRPDGRTIQVE